MVGSSNVDSTIYCGRLPGPGETVLGGKFSSTIGGKGANQATAARRMGASTSFFSAVGDDSHGEMIKAHFAKEGVNAHWAVIPSGIPTGVALILVDPRGQNSIAVAPGANQAITSHETKGLPYASFSHVLISLEIPMAVAVTAAIQAKEAGCCVLLNPAPAVLLPDELLSNIDILLPNEHEVKMLLPSRQTSLSHRQIAGRFFDFGGKALIVTLGERGAEIHEPAGMQILPGIAADVVDTVGAGDCFCGALAAGLAFGDELAAAVRLANKAASLSVQRPGAISSLPLRVDVLQGLSAAV